MKTSLKAIKKKHDKIMEGFFGINNEIEIRRTQVYYDWLGTLTVEEYDAEVQDFVSGTEALMRYCTAHQINFELDHTMMANMCALLYVPVAIIEATHITKPDDFWDSIKPAVLILYNLAGFLSKNMQTVRVN